LAKVCRDAADEVERGRPLSEAVADRPQFPRNMIPMLAWGQQTNALPEAFVAVAQMYESRAESQKQLIHGVVIPLTFLMVFAMVGSVFSAVLTPLVSLVYYFMGMMRMAPASAVGSSSSLIPLEFGFSGMISPIILGTALLITKRLITLQHDPSNENVVEMGLKITGWVLIAVGVAGNFLCVMGYLSIFWWIALAFVAIMVWLKQRRARQKALLGAMAASTERFIPLAPTIEAFASDMRGRIGNRAARLADLMKNGIPLPDALRRVKRAVPSDSIPIVRTGYESGAFAQGLREAALAEDVQPALWGSLAGKMLYLTAVPPITIVILGFVATKVVPSFRSIFKYSDLQFSGFTRGLFAAFGWLEHIWPVFPFLILCFACLFFYCLLRSCGIPLFELPGMERIMRRKHTALILDSLALAVEHGRPLFNAFCSLAECYPKSSIRRRLNDAAYDLQQGVPWSASLYRRGLIRQSDWAVLKAAERAGNLVWAMRELAAGNRRRLAYRMEVLVQMLFPPVVLCFGAIVLFVVVALFVPLVTLIQSMS
jgi:type II secretory pathway component PulF